MPTLRKLGVVNIIVIMDAGIYDSLLQDEYYPYHTINVNDYTLVRKENAHNGVFHPKMTLLFGSDEGSIIVGSGNITFSGLSHNEEVWNAFHVDGNDSEHYPLFRKAWNYIQSLSQDFSPLVKRQLKWIIDNCEWLSLETEDKPVTLATKETVWLLHNNNSACIFDTLIDTVGRDKVNEITVIAPFFDVRGDALTSLNKSFKPSQFKCILDRQRQSAPYAILGKDNGITYYEYIDETNPLHAKIIQFTTNKGTWLLSGSANASYSALGINRNHYNDELCVLIFNPKKNDYISLLGLKDKIKAIKTNELNKIKPPTQNEPTLPDKEVIIQHSEYDEKGLHICFSKEGISGNIVVFDCTLNEIFTIKTFTSTDLSIEIPENIDSNMNLVVLQRKGDDISNRSLIIKESQVERCNPDPKRREFSKLLTDEGIMDNLNKILDFIPFEVETHKSSNVNNLDIKKNHEKDDNDEVETIQRKDFNNLKDKSKLSISLQPSIQILDYLSKLFFNLDKESKDNDMNGRLENARPEDDINYEEDNSNIQLANNIEISLLSYLKRMNRFLIQNINESENLCPGKPEVDNLPILNLKLNLNMCAALDVACKLATYLLFKYDELLNKKDEISSYLIDNTALYCSLYHNNYPNQDTNNDKKCRELLTEAASNLLLFLSTFHYYKEDVEVILLTILNCLVFCGNNTEELNKIYDLYYSLLEKTDKAKDHTVALIKRIISQFKGVDKIPIKDITVFMKSIFIYRKDYGFFNADDIHYISNKWEYSYWQARLNFMKDTKEFKGTGSKFKGFRLEDFIKS